MEQFPDKSSFNIILRSDDKKESTQDWQIRCEYLYIQLCNVLPKGTVSFSHCINPSLFINKSICIISYHTNDVSYAALEFFIITTYKIIHYWSINTPYANIEIISPDWHIDFKYLYSNLQRYFDEVGSQRENLRRIRYQEDKIRIKRGHPEQLDKIAKECSIRKLPESIEGRSEDSENKIIIDRVLHQISETTIKNYSEEIDKIVNEEFKRLSTGHITFNIAKTMKTGVSENAQANIAKTLSQIIEKVKDYNLRSEIKISPSMRVSLKGESGIFDVQAITKEVQLITDDVTTWEWTVKPLKSGEQTLFLSVDVIIEVPQCSIKEHSLPTLKEKIVVKVNPWYYIQCHSGVIIGTLGTIIGIATVLVAILTFIYKK